VKIYRYPEPTRPPVDDRLQRVEPQPEEEEALTGLVQGKDASDLEEMYARSLSKDERVLSFRFREVYGAPTRSQSGAIELDFYVVTGPAWPVQIDAEFTHKDADTRAHDALQDQLLDEILLPEGARPVQRVRLTGRETQEEIDTIEERMF